MRCSGGRRLTFCTKAFPARSVQTRLRRHRYNPSISFTRAATFFISSFFKHVTDTVSTCFFASNILYIRTLRSLKSTSRPCPAVPRPTPFVWFLCVSLCVRCRMPSAAKLARMSSTGPPPRVLCVLLRPERFIFYVAETAFLLARKSRAKDFNSPRRTPSRSEPEDLFVSFLCRNRLHPTPRKSTN